MGFIKGSLLFIVSVVFFVMLIFGCVFLTISLSLKYENVEKEFPVIAENLTDGKFNLIEEDFNLTKEMEKASEFMVDHCNQSYTLQNSQNDTLQNQNASDVQKSSEDLPVSYVFSAGGYVFVIPCSLLDELDENPQALTESGISNIVNHIYYEEYDCNFWDCFKKAAPDFSFSSLFREKQIGWKGTLFLVSEKARDYWHEKFNSALIVLLVLTVLIFLLTGQKQNTPLIIGALMMSSSFVLLWFKNIFEGVTKIYLVFLSLFFSKTGTVFWILFISGLIIFSAGIALRFLQGDSLKKKFSKRDILEIIREEIHKIKERGAGDKKKEEGTEKPEGKEKNLKTKKLKKI